MYRIFISLLILSTLFVSCDRSGKKAFHSDWHRSPDGNWAGPDCWANRLQDWQVKSGRLECVSNKPLRTVHLMSMRVGKIYGTLSLSTDLYVADHGLHSVDAGAGFLIGAGRESDFRKASLIFHSTGHGAGFFAGLDNRGNIFVKDLEQRDVYLYRNNKKNIPWKVAKLILTVSKSQDASLIDILAVNPFTNEFIDKAENIKLPAIFLNGNVGLVSDPGKDPLVGSRYAFGNWEVKGSRLELNPGWNKGPIVTAQYTLSRGRLKVSAQFMPLSGSDLSTATLQIQENGEWKDADTSSIKIPSYTALFTVGNWTRTDDVPFRIIYNLRRGRTKTWSLNGIIRHDPADKEEIRMISLSCNEQIIRPDGGEYKRLDGGQFNFTKSILYPHSQLTENLKKYNADFLFFAGDQVYEGASPTAADLESPYLDYLYKWYLWCLTYRDLTTTIPSVAIPDDHDVYHGNLWGAGGIATPAGLSGGDAQDAGGYKMKPDFVNMVQETQTSHLPDPADPQPAAQGIGVYFTECNIGGISFAVIEDRKFKSAPKGLLPEAQITNGWPQNKLWNTRYWSRIESASLLGERQLKFLENWVNDWSNKTWMKAVLSQTLWANLATIPRDSMSDDAVPYMRVPDSTEYITGDKLATDFDSDGWPQPERDKAIRLIRKGFALHIAGDQHLGSTVQYGADQFRDAGFAIISPATGNIWPRHWFPPNEGMNRKSGWPVNYGDFEDGFGNKLTVFAVANPRKSDVEPVKHNSYSTGYSTIIFRKSTREIELSNWPYFADPEADNPFPNWPVKITQADNYGRVPAGWLPEIRFEGITDPVIRVIREYTGEVIYSLRISGSSFQPKVFEFGNYTVEAGDPDLNNWKKIERLYPTEFREREPLSIKF